ncbi:uncharacterized protein [Periplaneta americana]|uniref:uncharacterized protein n=1 Tax=Periplaneta americana TaxID=6978 RepID=UPI0037E97780
MMVLFVVAGIADDEVFQHVALIADHLSKEFPNFKVRQISKRREDWELFLDQEKREAQLVASHCVRRFCIVGAAHPMAVFLLLDILRLFKDGVVVTLCDAREFKPILMQLAADTSAIPADPARKCVKVATGLRSALDDCDVCIVLQHADCERFHKID